MLEWKDMRRGALAAAALGSTLLAGPALAATLVVASPNTPEGFDGDALRPHTQNVVVQTYEGLTKYGRMMKDGREVLDPARRCRIWPKAGQFPTTRKPLC